MVATSILSNARLIGIPSEGTGEDWFVQAQKIDRSLANFGMELAEETVYLLFDRGPGALAHGEGKCIVARPVIGPLRELPGPFILKDIVRTSVYTSELSGGSLAGVFDEAQEFWQELQRSGKKIGNGFTVCIRRRFGPELALKAQVIFTE